MISLAFYKGEGKLVDKIIRKVTRSKYSHVAVIVDGICIEADAWKGRVISRTWETNYNPENWDVVSVKVTDEVAASKFIVDQIGNFYDYVGIVGFCCLFGFNISNWWYCSELTAAFLGYKVTSVSPGDLAERHLGHR